MKIQALLIFLLFVSIDSIKSQVPYYSISTINKVDSLGVSDSLGVYCKTSGTVISNDFDGNNGYSFYITDRSSGTPEGLNVFNFIDINNYVVNPGDSILLFGTVIQFSGMQEIRPDSIFIISSGNQIPLARNVTALNETTEGDLVQLNNLRAISKSRNGNFNVEITNGVDTFSIRVDADTEITDSLSINSIEVGDTICSIVGICNQFDQTAPYFSGYQILPYYYSDLERISCAPACQKSIPSFSISPGNLCFGDSLLLQSTSLRTTANTVYAWDVDNDGLIDYNSTTVSHFYTTSGLKQIKLLLIDGACRDSITNGVNIFPKPNVDAGLDQSICKGDSVQIGGNPSSTSAGVSYFWPNVTGLSATNTANPIASPNNTQSYFLRVRNNYCLSVDTIVVHVTSINDSLILVGNVLSSIQAGATYQWLSCSNLGFTQLQGEISQNLNVINNGDYAVEITLNSCVDTSSCINVIGVGVENYTIEFDQVSIYPNPSKNLIHIDFTYQFPTRTIVVRDIIGKSVMNAAAVGQKNILEFELEKGVYTLEVIEGQSSLIKKFIVL